MFYVLCCLFFFVVVNICFTTNFIKRKYACLWRGYWIVVSGLIVLLQQNILCEIFIFNVFLFVYTFDLFLVIFTCVFWWTERLFFYVCFWWLWKFGYLEVIELIMLWFTFYFFELYSRVKLVTRWMLAVWLITDIDSEFTLKL